jgi:hypothetical protein
LDHQKPFALGRCRAQRGAVSKRVGYKKLLRFATSTFYLSSYSAQTVWRFWRHAPKLDAKPTTAEAYEKEMGDNEGAVCAVPSLISFTYQNRFRFLQPMLIWAANAETQTIICAWWKRCARVWLEEIREIRKKAASLGLLVVYLFNLGFE